MAEEGPASGAPGDRGRPRRKQNRPGHLRERVHGGRDAGRPKGKPDEQPPVPYVKFRALEEAHAAALKKIDELTDQLAALHRGRDLEFGPRLTLHRLASGAAYTVEDLVVHTGYRESIVLDFLSELDRRGFARAKRMASNSPVVFIVTPAGRKWLAERGVGT